MEKIKNAKQKETPAECERREQIKTSVYERKVKRIIDQILSFIGLLILAPVFIIIAVAIFFDDPGPVIFTQKRVGKYKHFFMLHKFRSMKRSTPHDIPTHQLENPELYITRVGKFLRKYSLDELPQIWDIFAGNMSIIGPRPALWNQDDLVMERDKYGANDIMPGLTGWAQINGRDELKIKDKAKLDGEYAEILKRGNIEALLFDIKCFWRTIFSVLRSNGVLEGGTGELYRTEKNMETEGNLKDYGYLKHFEIDISEENKKHVLITGAGSYIGKSFENWANEHYPVNFTIDTVDMQNQNWYDKSFSSYDIILHVAGIAHADVDKVSKEEKKKYYEVNTHLAIETAKKAKKDGVKQFVFMSSMIIYGNSVSYKEKGVIDKQTVPIPANFYGDSKLKAEKGIYVLADGEFHVAILRSPMIYGRYSKGNYLTLAKLAKKLPLFPDVENSRSMLYIDNLCEFLCKLMLSGEGGIYFPQNKEYTRTSEMVRQIAEVANKKIWITKLLNPLVVFGRYIPGKISRLMRKAFGNSAYDQTLSKYDGLDYQKVSLSESIKYTEGTAISENNIQFTVITVCYNSENEIKKTINSVLHQTYPYVEYIIIDGASTDLTVSIANEYKSRFVDRGYKYLIISEPDQGIYDAMNKGVKSSSGEMIGFINAGDWYERDAIETAAEEYKKSPYEYFYADIRLIRSDGSKVVKHSKPDHIITSRHWNHPSSFCIKKLYDELGGFQCKGIHDDFEFFLRVRKSNKQIRIVNKVIANFTMGGTSNEKSLTMCKKRIKDRYQGYRHNGYNSFYFLECVCTEVLKYILS